MLVKFQKEWCSFFRKLLEHYINTHRGNVVILSRRRGSSLKLNVKKISKVIEKNEELWENYMKVCCKCFKQSTCFYITFVLRHIMYFYYRRKVEPFYTLVYEILTKGHVEIKTLKKLIENS